MEAPDGERYDPVGSTNEECDSQSGVHAEREHFKELENEQELLSTSLQALTSHFAQVQFRLRQIISAPHEERISLIENLDEFASRGIPELKNCGEESACMSVIHQQRCHQFELIHKLRTELKAASKFANQKGIDFDERVACSEALMNNDFEDTTHKDLSNLKKQILHLDSFVTDLQYETINLQEMTQALAGYRNCDKIYKSYGGPLHHSFHDKRDDILIDFRENEDPVSTCTDEGALCHLKRHKKLQNFSSLDDIASKTNSRNITKQSDDHWGNISAKLEIDVQNIISMISTISTKRYQLKQTDGLTLILQREIARMVRKELCGTLRELIEHGLHSIQYQTNFIRCCLQRTYKQIPSNTNGCSDDTHAWNIILQYYNLNDGDQFYRKPINKLNESFQLKRLHELVMPPKQQLLKAIGDVINIHVRSNTNKSRNAYFKAFVLLALNSKMLPQWLSLIFKCTDLIDLNYSDESFVCQPILFGEALNCLTLLSNYEFNLPVDTLVDKFDESTDNLFN